MHRRRRCIAAAPGDDKRAGRTRLADPDGGAVGRPFPDRFQTQRAQAVYALCLRGAAPVHAMCGQNPSICWPPRPAARRPAVAQRAQPLPDLRKAAILTPCATVATSLAMTFDLPSPRGMLTQNRPLDSLTWLRVGGPADWLFQPADPADLADFLAALDPAVPVFPIGVGSNLIVRDGGIRGVVIRLGRGFNSIEIEGETVIAGAAALDAHVARRAADAGLDLTFLRTVPGSIGGAVRMNAGCYGSYVADHLVRAQAVTRDGRRIVLTPQDLNFAYRHSDLPEGAVVTEAVFRAAPGDPDALHRKMADQLARRDESQPTRERSAGSTFRNPAGFSSTGRDDDDHDLKAWSLIDRAGLRGHSWGGAQMSEKHPNFLLNAGGATAAELEALGELVRRRVHEDSGHDLQWEVIRVGDPLPDDADRP